MVSASCNLLLSGHDTIECAYYLARADGAGALDFAQLEAWKEEQRQTKSRRGKAVRLGVEEYLLASHGTRSGYPLLLENDALSIQCGEFNKPNFYVTYRSCALWHDGIAKLHQRFLTWAASVGYVPFYPERLSRVDFSFDYQLPGLDFDEDNFVSLAAKDNQHRKHGKVQTFSFGGGSLLVRVYDKEAEISEQSQKTWLYSLWGRVGNVWRVEFQVRKDWLKRFGIRTLEDLSDRQGDLLRHLLHEHTTLRVRTADSNRSRWPVHPLWQDLQERTRHMPGLGVVRECNRTALLDEQLLRLSVSVYGYLKRIGAIHGLKREQAEVSLIEAMARLEENLHQLHDPLTWDSDVAKRMTQIRFGQW